MPTSSSSVYAITEGGPLRHVERALHITRGAGRDWLRRVSAVLVIAYLPLLAAGALARLTSGAWEPELFRIDMHVGALVTIPLLLVAEPFIEARARDAGRYLYASGLASRAPDACAAAASRTAALRDAWFPELALLVFAIASCFVGATYIEEPAVATWTGIPLYSVARFLILRWLWRWFLWGLYLWRVARAPLALNATHPDRVAGLAPFLGPAAALSAVVAALSASLAASVGDQIVFEGAALETFRNVAITYAVGAVGVALLPGLVFAPVLYRAKVGGLGGYGAFAHRFTRAFEARWFDASGEEALGASDISSLADLGGSYEVVPELGVFLWSRRIVILLAASALLPMGVVALFDLGVPALVLRIVAGVT